MLVDIKRSLVAVILIAVALILGAVAVGFVGKNWIGACVMALFSILALGAARQLLAGLRRGEKYIHLL